MAGAGGGDRAHRLTELELRRLVDRSTRPGTA